MTLERTLATVLLCSLIAACSPTNPEWEKARKLDTLEAYAQFEKQFPASQEAALARSRRAALADEREWRGANRVDTAEAYAAYIAQHPQGVWAARARARQAELIAAAPPVPTPATTEAVEKAAGVRAAEDAKPAPAEKSPPEKSPAAKPRTAVTLQLGAFSSAERAQKSWREAQNIVASLRNAKPLVVHGSGSNLYRLRVEVESRADGERICAALRKAGASCIEL